jgi:hypothetical protein
LNGCFTQGHDSPQMIGGVRHRPASSARRSVERGCVEGQPSGLECDFTALSSRARWTPGEPTGERREAARHLGPWSVRVRPPSGRRAVRAGRAHAGGRSSDSRALRLSPAVLLAVASRTRVQCFVDGGRSRSPLRGSSGFAPDSLLPHPRPNRG